MGFNVVYEQFRAMYDSDCQVCCNYTHVKTYILFFILYNNSPKGPVSLTLFLICIYIPLSEKVF